MNRNLSTPLFLILLALLAASACSSGGADKATGNTGAQQQQNAAAQSTPAKALPEDVVVASAEKVELQGGKPAQEALVKLTIKEGYHINANPPSKYQIATQLTPGQSEGLTAGQPVYPPSLTKKFKFSDQPLAVYEKEAVINLPLTAVASAPKGERTLPAQLRFQACDDEVCYSPKTLQVQIPVSVK